MNFQNMRHMKRNSKFRFYPGILKTLGGRSSTSKLFHRKAPEAHSEPCQTSKMECFAKIVHGLTPLTIFAERSILDV